MLNLVKSKYRAKSFKQMFLGGEIGVVEWLSGLVV